MWRSLIRTATSCVMAPAWPPQPGHGRREPVDCTGQVLHRSVEGALTQRGYPQLRQHNPSRALARGPGWACAIPPPLSPADAASVTSHAAVVGAEPPDDPYAAGFRPAHTGPPWRVRGGGCLAGGCGRPARDAGPGRAGALPSSRAQPPDRRPRLGPSPSRSRAVGGQGAHGERADSRQREVTVGCRHSPPRLASSRARHSRRRGLRRDHGRPYRC